MDSLRNVVEYVQLIKPLVDRLRSQSVSDTSGGSLRHVIDRSSIFDEDVPTSSHINYRWTTPQGLYEQVKSIDTDVGMIFYGYLADPSRIEIVRRHLPVVKSEASSFFEDYYRIFSEGHSLDGLPSRVDFHRVHIHARKPSNLSISLLDQEGSVVAYRNHVDMEAGDTLNIDDVRGSILPSGDSGVPFKLRYRTFYGSL